MGSPLPFRLPSRRSLHLGGGLLLWAAALTALVVLAARRGGGGSPLGRTWGFAVSSPVEVTADLPEGSLSPGDRVMQLRTGGLRVCGEVGSVSRPAVGTARVRLALFPDAGLPSPLPPGTRLTRLDARGTLEWALSRVLSPERQAALVGEVKAILAERSTWFDTTLRPVLEEYARGAVNDVVAELLAFLQEKQSELATLGEEILERVRARWEPILEELVWPRVLAGLEPLGVKIGNALWDALPLGEAAEAGARAAAANLWNRFAPAEWRADDEQFDRWRETFLRDKAVPIVEAHLPEALAVVEGVVRAAWEEPRVQAALRSTLVQDGLSNPKVGLLLMQAFTAGVLNNPRLSERLRTLIADPRLRRALFDLTESVEDRLLGLVRSFLVDPGTGRLHPELAVLARVRLIGTEGDWVLLELPEAGDPPPVPGAPRVIREYAGTETAAWRSPE